MSSEEAEDKDSWIDQIHDLPLPRHYFLAERDHDLKSITSTFGTPTRLKSDQELQQLIDRVNQEKQEARDWAKAQIQGMIIEKLEEQKVGYTGSFQAVLKGWAEIEKTQKNVEDM
jgi:flagellar hook-basal body complex protein FliE